jgi:hypothetical protein
MLLPVQERLLVRSDRSSTGFKGVRPHQGQYRAECTRVECNHHIGRFGTPEEAAQAYLQHLKNFHPAELGTKRAPRPLQVQEHLLSKTMMKPRSAKAAFTVSCSTGASGKHFEISELELFAHMHLNLKAAAKVLKLSISKLKRICRDYNVLRWPGRKLIAAAKIFQCEPRQVSTSLSFLSFQLPVSACDVHALEY